MGFKRDNDATSVGGTPASDVMTKPVYDPSDTGNVSASETIQDRLILLENVSEGQLVYLSDTPLVAGVGSGGVADKDTPAKRPAIACALETGTTGQTIKIIQNGLVPVDTSSFSVGDIVSLGNSGAFVLQPKKSDQQVGIITAVGNPGQMLMQQGSFNKTNIRGSVKNGQMLKFNLSDNELEPSDFIEDGVKIKTKKDFFAKKVKTAPASLEVGPGFIMSNGGNEFLQSSISNSSTPDNAFLPRKNFDYTLGTNDQFTTGRIVGTSSSVVLQGSDVLLSDDPGAVTANNDTPGKVKYVITPTEDRLISEFRSRFNTVQTGIRLIIRLTNGSGPVVFTTEVDETWEDGAGFTSVIYAGSGATETVVNIEDAPLLALNGVTYHVTWESTVGDIVMLGDIVSTEYIPYFERTIQSIVFDPVVAAKVFNETGDKILDANGWYSYVFMDATSGSKTVTLPASTGALGMAMPCTVYKSDATANTVTVLPFGGETISGAASVVISSQHESATIVGDGTNARLINVEPSGGGGSSVIDTYEANATGSTTTGSGTDVVVSSMTLTPGAGDYIAWFSSSWENSATSDTIFVSIYVNGSQIATTERRYYIDGSIPDTAIPVATHDMITGLGAGEDIDIRWRTTGGTATMYQRKLTLIRVG